MNREAERKRLVELIGDLPFSAEYEKYDSWEWAEHFADHLLENGIVVPPCKVGDELYVTLPKGVFKRRIFTEEVKGFSISVITDKSIFPVKMIGETVFLTREQAEKELEGKGE